MKLKPSLCVFLGMLAASPVLANPELAQKKNCMGVWGQIPMPANPQVSEAEAKQLVTWVLSTK